MTDKNILQSLFSSLLKNKNANSTQTSGNTFSVESEDVEMKLVVSDSQIYAKYAPTSKKDVSSFVSRNFPSKEGYCLNLGGGGVFVSDSLAPLIERLNEYLKSKSFETISAQAVYSSFNRKGYYLHTVYVERMGVVTFPISKCEKL